MTWFENLCFWSFAAALATSCVAHLEVGPMPGLDVSLEDQRLVITPADEQVDQVDDEQDEEIVLEDTK